MGVVVVVVSAVGIDLRSLRSTLLVAAPLVAVTAQARDQISSRPTRIHRVLHLLTKRAGQELCEGCNEQDIRYAEPGYWIIDVVAAHTMSATLSLAQSSFLLSSLVAPTPHRDDGRSLDAYRPIELHPPIEAGYAHIQLGSTSVTAHASCQAVRSTTSIDQSSEDDNDDGANDDEGSGEGAGLWNVNISTASNVVPPVSNGGNSSKTGCVELDAQLDHLTHLIKRHLTSVVPVEQFLILKNSSHAMATTHAEKLRGATYWAVHVDITIESMAGGNLYDTIWASTVASLYRLRIPRTREIAYIPPGATEDVAAVEELGIKSLKGQGKQKQQQQTQGKAIDFELVDGNEEGGELVKGRELLGAGITVGLVSGRCDVIVRRFEH